MQPIEFSRNEGTLANELNCSESLFRAKILFYVTAAVKLIARYDFIYQFLKNEAPAFSNENSLLESNCYFKNNSFCNDKKLSPN